MKNKVSSFMDTRKKRAGMIIAALILVLTLGTGFVLASTPTQANDPAKPSAPAYEYGAIWSIPGFNEMWSAWSAVGDENAILRQVHDMDVIIQYADFSYNYLNDLLYAIATSERLDSFQWAGVDVSLNRVVVGLNPYTDEEISRFLSEIIDSHALIFEEVAAAVQHWGTPFTNNGWNSGWENFTADELLEIIRSMLIPHCASDEYLQYEQLGVMHFSGRDAIQRALEVDGLVAVRGIEFNEGWAYARELHLFWDMPTNNPEEALVYMQALENFANEHGNIRYVNVYDFDGETVIDLFRMYVVGGTIFEQTLLP